MKKVLVAMLAAAGLSLGSAQAAIMTIHATSVTPGISDWDITFNDTGDGLLQLAEVTSFSGFTLTGSGAADGTYTVVSQVADIAGVAAGGGGFLWGFKKTAIDPQLAAGATRWTYCHPGVDCPTDDNTGGGNGVVPEPAVWTLMIGAFAALGLAMRRRFVRA